MQLRPARQLVPRRLAPVRVLERVLQLVGLPVKIRRRKWRQTQTLGVRALAAQRDPVWRDAIMTGSPYQRLQRYAKRI